MDWDADFLAGFDICVASVHSHFTQSAGEMTAPVRSGPARTRTCNIIGHPTTRQIGRRAAGRRRLGRGVRRRRARPAPRWRSTAYPDRLDLPDELVLRAKRHGVKFAINTDSHSTVHLGHLRYGVGLAQRGLADHGRRHQHLAAVEAAGVRRGQAQALTQGARSASRSQR